jgi:hypothetical protein
MKKLITIILIFISLGSYAQTPPRTGYLVQTAKWKFVNPIWLDSGAYITKIPKYGGQNRYLVYDSITGKVGYRYVSASGNFVPYTGATTDVNIGTNTYIGHSLKSDASDGVLIEAGNGTDVGIFGAGNTANSSLYGGLTIGSLTSGNAADSVVVANSTGLLKKRPSSAFGSTYTAGNGIIISGSVIYRDSLKTTGQYGNSWQNGMYLGSSNNRSVIFRTNNQQRMGIDSNGIVNIVNRLGIGTRTPITLAQFSNNNSPFISITDSRTVDSLSTLRIGNVSDGSTYSYSGIWSGRSGLNYGSQMKLLFVPLTTILNVENGGSVQFRVNNNAVGVINSTSMTANGFRQDAANLNYFTGNVNIGSSGSTASAALSVVSTTKGFLPPTMTTTQRTSISSPAEGLTVYDLTLHKLYVYDGTSWVAAW